MYYMQLLLAYICQFSLWLAETSICYFVWCMFDVLHIILVYVIIIVKCQTRTKNAFSPLILSRQMYFEYKRVFSNIFIYFLTINLTGEIKAHLYQLIQNIFISILFLTWRVHDSCDVILTTKMSCHWIDIWIYAKEEKAHFQKLANDIEQWQCLMTWWIYEEGILVIIAISSFMHTYKNYIFALMLVPFRLILSWNDFTECEKIIFTNIWL